MNKSADFDDSSDFDEEAYEDAAARQNACLAYLTALLTAIVE